MIWTILTLIMAAVAVEVIASVLSAGATIAYYVVQIGEPPSRMLLNMGILPVAKAYITGFALTTGLNPSMGLSMIVHNWSPIVPVAVVASYLVAIGTVYVGMSHFGVLPL